MTISSRVRQQFYHPEHLAELQTQQETHHQSRPNNQPQHQPQHQHQHRSSPVRSHVNQLIRIPQTKCGSNDSSSCLFASPFSRHMWTAEEHDRFLRALELFPEGPWKAIAQFIGTKTPRQAMSHAQKYRQKIARRQRGLKGNPPTTSHPATRTMSSTSTTVPPELNASLLDLEPTKYDATSISQQDATLSADPLCVFVHMDRRTSQYQSAPTTKSSMATTSSLRASSHLHPLSYRPDHQDHLFHQQKLQAQANQLHVELRPAQVSADHFAVTEANTSSNIALHHCEEKDNNDQLFFQFLDSLMDQCSLDDLSISSLQHDHEMDPEIGINRRALDNAERFLV